MKIKVKASVCQRFICALSTLLELVKGGLVFLDTYSIVHFIRNRRIYLFEDLEQEVKEFYICDFNCIGYFQAFWTLVILMFVLVGCNL